MSYLRIHSAFSDYIDRNSVRIAFSHILMDAIDNKHYEVEVDFTNVNFVSRSAMHELILIQKEAQSLNFKINIINLNHNITEIRDAIFESFNRPKTLIEMEDSSFEELLTD